MAVTEHPYSYAALMGLSGLAFRVRWCNEATQTKWCGSCPIGEMPDEYRALEAHTGWSFPTMLQFGIQNPDRAAIRERLVHAIDAGRPVLAYAATLDMTVVYGYEDGGNTLFVRDYS